MQCKLDLGQNFATLSGMFSLRVLGSKPVACEWKFLNFSLYWNSFPVVIFKRRMTRCKTTQHIISISAVDSTGVSILDGHESPMLLSDQFLNFLSSNTKSLKSLERTLYFLNNFPRHHCVEVPSAPWRLPSRLESFSTWSPLASKTWKTMWI